MQFEIVHTIHIERICGKKKESNKEVEGEERKYLAEGTLWKAKWRERIINEDNNSEMLQS